MVRGPWVRRATDMPGGCVPVVPAAHEQITEVCTRRHSFYHYIHTIHFDNWFMDEGGCLRACYVASAEPADAMLSHPFDGSTSLPCDNVRVRVTLLEWSILIFGLAYVPLPLSALCSLRRGSRMWSLGRRYSQILRDACHRSG